MTHLDILQRLDNAKQRQEDKIHNSTLAVGCSFCRDFLLKIRKNLHFTESLTLTVL